MPRKPDPEGRRKKEVLQAAIELFAKAGYHGTSMGDLATETNLNKGTLYYYFASKNDILFAIFTHVADAMLERLSDANFVGEGTYTERLRQLIRCQLEVIAEKPAAVRIYYRESSMLDAWMPQDQVVQIRAREATYNNAYISCLRRGIEAGEFKESVDPKLVAFGVIGIGAWVSTWYRAGGPTSITAIAEMYGDVVVDGLARQDAD